MRLRVLSFNVWALPPPVGHLVNERIALILRDLPGLDCDVALFQEVWTDEARAQMRAGGVAAGFPHMWASAGPARGGGGLLALSKTPIRNAQFRRYTLCGLPQRFTQMDYYSGKGVARLEIAFAGDRVAIFNTHLHARYAAPGAAGKYVGHRSAELIELADELRAVPGPVIAVGDFNLRDTSPEYRLLRQMTGLVDSAAVLDARKPTSMLANFYRRDRGAVDESRIDYVFSRSGESLGSKPVLIRRVFDDAIEIAGQTGGYSDHAGLVADIEIGGPGLPLAEIPETAFALARELLADGRAQADGRRLHERLGAGVGLAAVAAAVAARRRPGLTRRRFLRASLTGLAGVAAASSAGLATLSERFVPQELAGYDQVLALLARLEAGRASA